MATAHPSSLRARRERIPPDEIDDQQTTGLATRSTARYPSTERAGRHYVLRVVGYRTPADLAYTLYYIHVSVEDPEDVRRGWRGRGVQRSSTTTTTTTTHNPSTTITLSSSTHQGSSSSSSSRDACGGGTVEVRRSTGDVLRGDNGVLGGGERETDLQRNTSPSRRSWHISKRYSQFRALRDDLCAVQRELPALPHKRFFGNLRPKFVRERARGLNTFLWTLASSSVLCDNYVVHRFLTSDVCRLPPNLIAFGSVGPDVGVHAGQRLGRASHSTGPRANRGNGLSTSSTSLSQLGSQSQTRAQSGFNGGVTVGVTRLPSERERERNHHVGASNGGVRMRKSQSTGGIASSDNG
jgi:hypothetical protein